MSIPRFRKVLLLGSGGLLGRRVAERLAGLAEVEGTTALEIARPDRRTVDITDKGAIAGAVEEFSPDLILNCAAMANVEGAEEDAVHAFMVNAVAVENLARLAKEQGAALLHVSTDYVFDGEKESAYSEEDFADPRNVYGASKQAGEMAVLAGGLEKHWVLRTSWLHGQGGGHFPALVARLAKEQAEITIVDDQRGSPTSTSLVADAILTIAGLDGGPGIESGLVHVCAAGECSWYDLARRVVGELEARGESLAIERVTAVSTEEYAERCRAAGKTPPGAARPARSTLDCGRYERLTGKRLPSWEDALAAEMAEGLEAFLGAERTRGEESTEHDSAGQDGEVEPR